MTRALGEASGGAGEPPPYCSNRTIPREPRGSGTQVAHLWPGPSPDAQLMRAEIDWPHRPGLLWLLPCYPSRREHHPHLKKGPHLVLWVPRSQQPDLELNTTWGRGCVGTPLHSLRGGSEA